VTVATDRIAAERGSVLMLMPAAVLILVILGAFALDRAVAFGAQRSLVATAQSAANNGAGGGLDIDLLRSTGKVDLDPAAVGRQVHATVAASGQAIEVSWSIEGDTVVVRLHQRVRYIFGPAVPGGDRDAVVGAVARANLRRR